MKIHSITSLIDGKRIKVSGGRETTIKVDIRYLVGHTAYTQAYVNKKLESGEWEIIEDDEQLLLEGVNG